MNASIIPLYIHVVTSEFCKGAYCCVSVANMYRMGTFCMIMDRLEIALVLKHNTNLHAKLGVSVVHGRYFKIENVKGAVIPTQPDSRPLILSGYFCRLLITFAYI